MSVRSSFLPERSFLNINESPLLLSMVQFLVKFLVKICPKRFLENVYLRSPKILIKCPVPSSLHLCINILDIACYVVLPTACCNFCYKPVSHRAVSAITIDPKTAAPLSPTSMPTGIGLVGFSTT